MKEASFYTKVENEKVQCDLCPHHCKIAPGKTGICNVRKNEDGVLYSLVYGKPIAKHVDPIEKKPLFHFYPGSSAFSIATPGCNLRCLHCQNADISQAQNDVFPPGEISVEEVVQEAKRSGASSIAYTYTEPTIFYEYAFDIAKRAQTEGLKNVFVTNGYITTEALDHIAPFLDAANIDLKSMSESFYSKVCGAHLQPVLDAIKKYYELGIWIEVTTLIIPGYNDDSEELKLIAQFLTDIDPMIPWHVTAFYPTYKLTEAAPTSETILKKAVEIGKNTGLSYVYQGNMRRGEDTFCSSCGKLLIQRQGYMISKYYRSDGTCPVCSQSIQGVGIK
jgi:pyruvate formate lyase activating enzyme